MPRKIDDIFNECFERMLTGESLESCLSRYPKEAAELETLLRTAFDVKRRVWPVQPRPEFKHWARVRLQSAQYSAQQQKQISKPRALSWQRSWAFALTAVLVLVLASSGTAAAASQAMPDQPLYPVKLATEEIRVALTIPTADKAAVHAQLAETRAQEIAVMASQGKTNYVVSTSTKLVDQLQKAEIAIQEVEEKEARQAAVTPRATVAPSPPTGVSPQPPAGTTPQPPTGTTTPSPTTPTPAPAPTVPTPSAIQEKPPAGTTALPSTTGKPASTDKPGVTLSDNQTKVRINEAERIKELVKKSTSRNLTVLENALEKAPESAKPALNQAIDRARQTYERTQQQHVTGTDAKPTFDKPGLIPGKPAPTSNNSTKTLPKNWIKPTPVTIKPPTGVTTPPTISPTPKPSSTVPTNTSTIPLPPVTPATAPSSNTSTPSTIKPVVPPSSNITVPQGSMLIPIPSTVTQEIKSGALRADTSD